MLYSYSCCSVIKLPVCPVDCQTPWTPVRVAVGMEQTAVSPVSVTHPVSAITTVVLTTARCAKVSDRSPHFYLPICKPCLFVSLFTLCVCVPPRWRHIL